MKDLKRTVLLGAITLACGSLLAGCTVEQTEEGDMPNVEVSGEEGALPAYDVDVTQTEEGELPDVDVAVEGGNLPEYDVDAAEVEVGSREVGVTVPEVDVDVDAEERQVRVPTVDVDTEEDVDDDNQ